MRCAGFLRALGFIVVFGHMADRALGEIDVPIALPAPLNANAASDSGQDLAPRLAFDGNGLCVAVWHSTDSLNGTIGTDMDILFARSSNWGQTWSPPAALNSTAAGDTNRSDRFPHIAADGTGRWIAAWESNNSMNGTLGNDFDIFVSRSLDDGLTWTAPAALNGSASSDFNHDYDAFICPAGNGAWLAVWRSLDTLQGTLENDADILFARSVDHGVTWTFPAPLHSNAVNDVSHDIAPRVAGNGQGGWIAAWHCGGVTGGTFGIDYDIAFSRSLDNGATWSPIASVDANALSDGNAEDTNAAIACRGIVCVIAWVSTNSLNNSIGTDQDILFARSDDFGLTWSPPAALNLNASGDGGADQLPYLAVDDSGNWFAVWHSDEPFNGLGADIDIFISHSGDDGQTWSYPAPLNINAAGDSGHDQRPCIAFGRADASTPQGAVFTAWESRDSLGGTIGDDDDVLFARFALPDCNRNTLPDAAEPDSNRNGVPDDCDDPAPNACAADIAPPGPPIGNGVVNVDDLLAVISAWGPCPPQGGCAADIAPSGGGNGIVNVDDLLAVISAWGPCK